MEVTPKEPEARWAGVPDAPPRSLQVHTEPFNTILYIINQSKRGFTVKSLRLISGIVLLLLIAVSCTSAQTPLWIYPSPHQSTTDRVVDLALSKNGATIAFGDSNFHIMNRTGAEFGSFLHANSVGMSTDGTWIAAAMDDGLHVFFQNRTGR